MESGSEDDDSYCYDDNESYVGGFGEATTRAGAGSSGKAARELSEQRVRCLRGGRGQGLLGGLLQAQDRAARRGKMVAALLNVK